VTPRCEPIDAAPDAGKHQRIVRLRRDYNRWVADQTLEDYALRFTAKSARRWSTFRVANTAIGGISFLALEAIGGAITLTYGFTNAVAAILVVGAVIFVTGLPIGLYAARHGVDIDLLTRGAGFGYLGSTITSLIYATFTFIFFAIEAAIMAKALQMSLGLPEWIGFVVSSMVVIPLVTYGFTFISRFQLWTQPLWIALHAMPFVYIALYDTGTVEAWTHHTGRLGRVDGAFDLILFGSASGVVFSLIAQIGEQVDFLRFLPSSSPGRAAAWWSALIATGPGWIFLGTLKLLAGSFLAFLAFKSGVTPSDASEPTHMYQVAFGYVVHDPQRALAIAALFVVLSQLKINVTNSYAGSIAWSNFFSRLTHSHPGRVVWVVFNVVIALLLMELGIYKSLEQTLGLYAHVAVAWVGTIFADLVINKPLGLSPAGIEFKRAHLFDINPVGFGGMLSASVVSIAAHTGVFGSVAAALSCFVGLATALIVTPLIAWATRGRWYIARRAPEGPGPAQLRCCICEHTFETEDMARCPAYAGPICSLCCTLDARCGDQCKTESRLSAQILATLAKILPDHVLTRLNSSLGHYLGLLVLVGAISGGILAAVYLQSLNDVLPPEELLAGALIKTFLAFLLIAGVVCWLFVLAHESRVVAQEESSRQTGLLMQEIAAHEQTDRALQSAKEIAEAANLAKSRYLAGISHEFRTPLNAILGYAQLIDHDALPPTNRANAIRTIRRSGEHLAGLVEGLLDIARIEAGRLTPERNVFDFAEFVEQIVDMFRLQAETRGVAFRFEPSGRSPRWVRTDEKRLRQILINLLSNAIKFTLQGEVVFQLRFRNEVAEFIIEDTGIGIAEADLERVFMPFERIDNPAAPWIPGTGLGLTITKLMTEVMGGEISMKSRLGEGSRFMVRLHLPEVAPPQEATVAASRITGHVGPPITVLIADDEPSHRQLIEDLLGPLGIEVLAVPDGESCLELAARARPRVVLLDITMPGPSGWEVARRLREDLTFSGAIIMISADAAEETAEDGRYRYHDDYVVKPIVVDTLLDKIGRAADVTWIRDGSPVPDISGELAQELAHDGLHVPPRSARVDLPERSDLEDLKTLAQIGYIRAISERLEEIASRSPSAAPFIGQLAAMVAEVRIDFLLATLEAALDDIDAAACVP